MQDSMLIELDVHNGRVGDEGIDGDKRPFLALSCARPSQKQRARGQFVRRVRNGFPGEHEARGRGEGGYQMRGATRHRDHGCGGARFLIDCKKIELVWLDLSHPAGKGVGKERGGDPVNEDGQPASPGTPCSNGRTRRRLPRCPCPQSAMSS